jgi:hypothetical protein
MRAANTQRDREPIVGQAALAKLKGSSALSYVPRNQAVSFSVAFRELAQVSAGVESLRFEDLERYISSAQTSAQQPIEFLGLRIASRHVILIGVPALLCVQLYAWLHLKVLRRRTRSLVLLESVAWIGVYDLPNARLVTGVTFFVLPVTSVFLQGPLFVSDNIVYQLMAALAILISVGLATAGYWEMSSARRDMRRHSAFTDDEIVEHYE